MVVYFEALVVVRRLVFDAAGLWAVLNWRPRGTLVLSQFGTRRHFHFVSSRETGKGSGVQPDLRPCHSGSLVEKMALIGLDEVD